MGGRQPPGRAGIRRADLPWRFDGDFFLFAFHGAHSRVVLRRVELPTIGDGDEERHDEAAIRSTDVMFMGVRRLRLDLTMNGLDVRVATDAEAARILGPTGPTGPLDGERLFLLGRQVADGWIVARAVWWTAAWLPTNAPSPLLADLDFTVPDFTWERTGHLIHVNE
jgi:hypothetical protein